MKKIIHMVTVSKSIVLMKGQLEYLKDNGYAVGIVSSAGKEQADIDVSFNKSIEMERDIHIVKDIKSLIKMTKYLKKEKPDIINAGTPKAGLIGIIASFFSKVPNRVYTMRGLRLESETGIKKYILWITEKISCLLATEVICISPSLLKKAKKIKLINKKGKVLNKGSSNGLDISNYPLPREKKIEEFIENFNLEHKIKENDFVLGFVGRLTKDKGIYELIDVFLELTSNYSNLKLIIIGSFDGDLNKETINIIINHDSIHYLGAISDLPWYYYLFDVLVFPTHREGFGNVSIEAQAASVPVITTNATGARDTIINNETGLIYPVGDKEYLKHSIIKFYNNEIDKKKFGENGRLFVEKNFQSISIWKELDQLYKKLLKNHER